MRVRLSGYNLHTTPNYAKTYKKTSQYAWYVLLPSYFDVWNWNGVCEPETELNPAYAVQWNVYSSTEVVHIPLLAFCRVQMEI
jgi:hypothetical protein